MNNHNKPMYSYYCNRCGYWSISPNKKEIQKIERIHRVNKRALGIDSCGLRPVGDGTVARPDLMPFIPIEAIKAA